jgi:hypothetical protein
VRWPIRLIGGQRFAPFHLRTRKAGQFLLVGKLCSATKALNPGYAAAARSRATAELFAHQATRGVRVNQPLSIFVRNRLIINRKRRAESFDIAADRQAGQSAGRGR